MPFEGHRRRDRARVAAATRRAATEPSSFHTAQGCERFLRSRPPPGKRGRSAEILAWKTPNKLSDSRAAVRFRRRCKNGRTFLGREDEPGQSSPQRCPLRIPFRNGGLRGGSYVPGRSRSPHNCFCSVHTAATAAGSLPNPGHPRQETPPLSRDERLSFAYQSKIPQHRVGPSGPIFSIR